MRSCHCKSAIPPPFDQANKLSLHSGPRPLHRRILILPFLIIRKFKSISGATDVSLDSTYCHVPSSTKQYSHMHSALTLFLPKHEFVVTGPVRCYSRQDGANKYINFYWCNNCGSTLGHEKEIDNERIHISAYSATGELAIFNEKPVSKLSSVPDSKTNQDANDGLQRLFCLTSLESLNST